MDGREIIIGLQFGSSFKIVHRRLEVAVHVKEASIVEIGFMKSLIDRECTLEGGCGIFIMTSLMESQSLSASTWSPGSVFKCFNGGMIGLRNLDVYIPSVRQCVPSRFQNYAFSTWPVPCEFCDSRIASILLFYVRVQPRVEDSQQTLVTVPIISTASILRFFIDMKRRVTTGKLL
jgi:hypothetical protein